MEPDERARAQAAWRAVKEEEAVAARHCKLDWAATRKSADGREVAGRRGGAKGAAPEDGMYHLKHKKALLPRLTADTAV